MSLLKRIEDRGAVMEWSPLLHQSNMVALGTKDSAGIGFDDMGGELELHTLDFSDAKNQNTTVAGKARVDSKFSSIAWSQMANHQSEFSNGLIAGGMVDGNIHVWDPAKIIANDHEALLASVEQHTGGISGLHFNPHKDSSHLLASGGDDGEVFVTSLDRPDAPSVFVPAPPPSNAKHTAAITKVRWNTQVAHILASAAQNGTSYIWDLRQKRAWCELKDPAGGVVSDIAWNPDQGLHLVTASGDDKNPVIKLWDLRSSTSLPLATLQGHTEGILSISWCPADPSLLLSCAKDNKTLLWDLFHLQPVYELGSGSSSDAADADSGARGHSAAGGGDVFGGLATSAGQRRYNVSWSPCNTGVASVSSFDRRVEFFSLTGARSKIGRAPKWLRRPVGGSFAFGGKIVTFDNSQTSGASATAPAAAGGKKGSKGGVTVKISQVVEDEPLVKACDAFHVATSSGEHKQFCEEKSTREDSTEEMRQIWSLMNVICFGQNAREELLSHLGFDSKTISDSAEEYITMKKSASQASLSGVKEGGVAAVGAAVPLTPRAIGGGGMISDDVTVEGIGRVMSAQDLFGSSSAPPTAPSGAAAASSDDPFGFTPPSPIPSDKPTLDLLQTPPKAAATASPQDPPRVAAQMAIDESTDETLSKVPEMIALLLAGQEAEPTVRRAIIVGNFDAAVSCCLEAGLMAEALLLAQCGDQGLRVRTQAAFFKSQHQKHPFLKVLHAVIKNELMEYVKTSDLSRWRETLALLSTYGKSEEFPLLCEALAARLQTELNDTHSSTLCYMCATNLTKTVDFWTEELLSANKRLGQMDTMALQNFVEKVVVFTHSNPQAGPLGAVCNSFFAEYASILANQGRREWALNYLKGNSEKENILIDRLYHSGSKPATARPPQFPFTKINVEVGAAAQQYQQQQSNSKNNSNSFGSPSVNKQQQQQLPHQQPGSLTKQNSGGDNAAKKSAAANNHLLQQAQQMNQQQQQQKQQLQQQPAQHQQSGGGGLPAGWIMLQDPNSGHNYYVNQATGASQWEPPAAAPAAAAPAPTPAAPQPTQQVVQQHHQQASPQPAPVTVTATLATVSRPTTTTNTATATAATENPAVGSMECVAAFSATVDAIAASVKSPADKRMLVMVNSGLKDMREKEKTGDIAEDIQAKIQHISNCLASRNFTGASAIQTDLANTAWGQHKEWIKGVKVLIQLASKQ